MSPIVDFDFGHFAISIGVAFVKLRPEMFIVDTVLRADNYGGVYFVIAIGGLILLVMIRPS